MRDAAYVQFLQTYLPRLALRWQGFRKVRGHVVKRLKRRLRALQLPDLAVYEAYLASHVEEWAVLDSMCRIAISRFYRDHGVFEALGETVWPTLAQEALARQESCLRGWSAGCAGGEEVYTLTIALCYLQTIQAPVSPTLTGTHVRMPAPGGEGLRPAPTQSRHWSVGGWRSPRHP